MKNNNNNNSTQYRSLLCTRQSLLKRIHEALSLPHIPKPSFTQRTLIVNIGVLLVCAIEGGDGFDFSQITFTSNQLSFHSCLNRKESLLCKNQKQSNKTHTHTHTPVAAAMAPALALVRPIVFATHRYDQQRVAHHSAVV
jgi:hypothetical protein